MTLTSEKMTTIFQPHIYGPSLADILK